MVTKRPYRKRTSEALRTGDPWFDLLGAIVRRAVLDVQIASRKGTAIGGYWRMTAAQRALLLNTPKEEKPATKVKLYSLTELQALVDRDTPPDQEDTPVESEVENK